MPLAALDPDLLLFLLFLLFPLLGRILQALGERGKRQGQAPAPEGEARTRRKAEAEGESMWRRLLEGLEPQDEARAPRPPREAGPAGPAPPPERPAAPPERREPTRPAPPRGVRKRAAPRHAEPLVPSTPPPAAPPAPPRRGPEPVPTRAALDPRSGGQRGSVFASLQESTEVAVEAAGADAYGILAAAMTGSSGLSPLPKHPLLAVTGRDDLWRAVLWSEVLGPPLGLRDRDAEPSSWI